MPTHTHTADTHSHSYGHFSTAMRGVQRFIGNRFDEWVEAFGMVMDRGEIMTFKLVIKLISSGDLMQCNST
jgi:hypothetical protein